MKIRTAFYMALIVIVVVSFSLGRIMMKDVSGFQLYGRANLFSKESVVYHDTWTILEQVTKDSPEQSFYTMHDLTPTVADHALKILGYGPLEEPEKLKMRVLVICGQHGREYVSSEICYNLIKLLQVRTRDTEFTPKVAAFLEDGIGLWVVPVANPWARHLVETDKTKLCQRTNKNGVDLNRNFMHKQALETLRGPKSPFSDDGVSSEDNPGPAPMSEYETVAVAEYMDYVRPHIVINVHSGSNDILMPYDCCTLEELPPHYMVMVNLAKHVRDIACPECRVGTGSMALYPAQGTLIDYAIDFVGTQIAYTLEIFASPRVKNDHQLTNDECGEYFNPKEGEELGNVVRKWVLLIFTLIERVNEITY